MWDENKRLRSELVKLSGEMNALVAQDGGDTADADPNSNFQLVRRGAKNRCLTVQGYVGLAVCRVPWRSVEFNAMR
eukprot:2065337-Pyramimonas_sp.AAC.1